ncbi:MAG TPA: glycosyltransferase family 2 protein [Blastocatellia bacterium]|nr:glycosyltransferase family 2 protein [Blastocatellia bacterium]
MKAVTKISVAMCTYNGAKYLQEQLESISTQTRMPDELILCDDGSTDGTLEIAEKFAARCAFPMRIYVNETNLGSTKNFEKAIERCAGDIIALSDQDDIWHAKKLERIEAIFLSNPHTGLVFTNGEVINESLEPVGYSLWQCFGLTSARQKQMRKGKLYEILLLHNTVTGATMAFKSHFKKLILPIPAGSGLIHDGWIALLIASTAEVGFINEPLIKYRLHSNQQFGATRMGLLKMIARAKEMEAKSHLNIARSFAQARDRLRVFADIIDKDALSKIEEKIIHSSARGNMPDRRLSRLPYVIKELFTLRYHRYSRGLISFARDLLF